MDLKKDVKIKILEIAAQYNATRTIELNHDTTDSTEDDDKILPKLRKRSIGCLNSSDIKNVLQMDNQATSPNAISISRETSDSSYSSAKDRPKTPKPTKFRIIQSPLTKFNKRAPRKTQLLMQNNGTPSSISSQVEIKTEKTDEAENPLLSPQGTPQTIRSPK
jgi:hypothetical protein